MLYSFSTINHMSHFKVMKEDIISTELIASKTWGPILANLYLEDAKRIRLTGTYIDEEKDRSYPGPDYIISDLPGELKQILAEHPGRYLVTAKWQQFIRNLWQIVKDNPWFGYV